MTTDREAAARAELARLIALAEAEVSGRWPTTATLHALLWFEQAAHVAACGPASMLRVYADALADLDDALAGLAECDHPLTGRIRSGQRHHAARYAAIRDRILMRYAP